MVLGQVGEEPQAHWLGEDVQDGGEPELTAVWLGQHGHARGTSSGLVFDDLQTMFPYVRFDVNQTTRSSGMAAPAAPIRGSRERRG
ncbi:hypothetical protein GCM10009800_39650 [Nocardiopsis rhodophaea]